MKKILYIFIQIIALNCIGQNLVPNPGFEQYTICPVGFSEISSYLLWDSYSESPDYFNTCSTNANISPPNSYPGFQYPQSGDAYTGFCPFHSQFQNTRELIGAQLLSPLVVGQKYFISFYINSGGQHQATIATNKMGVKFSTVPYSFSNPAPINNTAHFYTDSIITDTAKWTKISGSFIADSAYSYIIIGNFFNDSLTDTISFGTNSVFAYYYLEDVCVSTDSLYCENWLGVKEQSVNKEDVTIYPNPCTNELNVKYNNVPYEQTTLSIIDIFGRIVMQVKTQESEYTFNTEKLPAGLYLLKAETGRTVATVKVNKE
ncbi:MAG: hypothetical protein A2X08_00080 [Bacteroidetes bacterium GWA2_32_17]|nr:MAG: hypothetical protein A2X08_00080 [Bacteroidetes bacterium GWA2_32_17]